MSARPGPKPSPTSPSTRALQRAREQFLAAIDSGLAPPLPHPSPLRTEIEASWVRSRQAAVDVDRVEPEYVERLDQESLLARCAAPVLRAVRAELAGEPIGIMVTDAHGTVLDRQCPDPDMAHRLDQARLAPGFVFAESSVGTNGIGMAIETRASSMVTGAEHYVESLKQFGCAGATILHPVTGAFMGVIDFTARAPHVNPLLLSFARSTAQRVQDRLLMAASARELALMRDYLAACHHTGGSVLAVSDGLVMMNVHTQQHYEPDDQTALLARISDVTGSSDPRTILAQLPSGGVARLDYRPAFAGDQVAGGVVRVQPARASGSSSPVQPVLVSLPGVVGSSLVWQQTIRSVAGARRDGEWLVLEGEPGVGKLLLARAVQQAQAPGSAITVLDAAHVADEGWWDDVATALDRRGGALVLTHADQLEAGAVRRLADQLTQAVSTDPPRTWVVLTVTTGATSALETVLASFPRTVEVPPLRLHLSDLDALTTHLLERVAPGTALTVSSPAAGRLRRMTWPGNVAQLRRLLVQVARHRRSGVVRVEDLPAEASSVSRHQLSPLQVLERDAIVAALAAAAGSKERAAQALGLSRATVYRKIKEYAITSD